MADKAQWRRSAIRLALSIVIGAGLGWTLVRGGLPIVPDRHAFASVRPWAVPVYIATLLGVHWFRAVRWRHLLRPLAPVDTRTVLSVCWLSFAAVMFLPLRMGEVVRPVLITKRSSVRGWQALGTVGAERVIDGLALSLILFVALTLTTPLAPLPERIAELDVPVAVVPRAAYAALALFAACFLMMGLFYAKRLWAQRLIQVMVGWASKRLAERIGTVVEGVAGGLRFLPSRRRLVPFLLETACYWAVNAFGLWLLAAGCGLPEVGFGEACVVMGCLGIGILVPAGPGYFGTFQLSVYLALAMFVLPTVIADAGSAFVFLMYSCQLGLHVLGALVGAVLDRTRAR